MYIYVQNYYFIKVSQYNKSIHVIIPFINNLRLNCLFTCGKVITKVITMRVLYLSVDVHDIPGVLEVPDVVVIQQSILLIGVEQGEVLHDDG